MFLVEYQLSYFYKRHITCDIIDDVNVRYITSRGNALLLRDLCPVKENIMMRDCVRKYAYIYMANLESSVLQVSLLPLLRHP